MDAYPWLRILALCRTHGPALDCPPGIDGAQLMVAIALCESSLGANCRPRHEPAYDHGGLYDRAEQAVLLSRYGSAAAYSYGPWQMMPVNAPSASPDQLASDAEVAARAFVAFVNRRIFAAEGARTVQQVGEAYNAGHFGPGIPPEAVAYGKHAAFYHDQVAPMLLDAEAHAATV